MKLLAGNSNKPLAQAIARELAAPLTNVQVKRFADNEVFAVIEENVRGEDVFILQSTSYPANDNLMELLILTDALVRASARRIGAPPHEMQGFQGVSAPGNVIGHKVLKITIYTARCFR